MYQLLIYYNAKLMDIGSSEFKRFLEIIKKQKFYT